MFSGKWEKGQSIIIIAVAMMMLVAMAALIIDGGNAYLNRRNAQTAADAAVLAAAHAKCVQYVPDDQLQPVVDEFAVTQNRATEASYTVDNADPDYPKGKITVETTITADTIFARVFRDDVTVKAKASAGCFLPGSAANLLPIAWTCRQPVGGSSDTCVLKRIPYPTWEKFVETEGDKLFFEANLLDEPLIDEDDPGDYKTDLDGTLGEGKMVYMVMDSEDFDPFVDCEELNAAGTINCDFNDDGYLDVEGGAERGWLLLDGTGASDLTELMLSGYPGVLELNQWFPGKSGVSNSVFINAEKILFRVSLIPVFNAVCEDTTADTLESDCSTEFQPGDLIKAGTGLGTYFRVPAVAAFVVTCVSKGPDYCPGKDLSGVKDNMSTIEGYFVSGYTGGEGVSNSGFDLGVYVFSLTE
jgi:Flp pilus assembly protein TadG